MRLVRLVVRNFQGIESAEVELAPGLNVLFGPNDLGKSSLAAAIRAALLLPHGSSAHERFLPWFGGGDPEVALTFTDSDGRYWRVTKTFGGGTTGRSKLDSSKDGRQFATEAQARNVDDKLRAMLRWGLHRPGGAGGPKGFPESFLTQVLLAEQDEVRKILVESSLENDPDPDQSGRLRLTDALGALAQDPMFKNVLERAQTYVDLAFTPKGKKKRAAGSPFIELAEQLKEFQTQRDEMEQRIRESLSTEDRIVTLNNERTEVDGRLAASQASLVALEQRFEVSQKRIVLGKRLADLLSTITEVEQFQHQILVSRAEMATAEQRSIAVAAELLAQNKLVVDAETARDAARPRFDAITRDDSPDARRIRTIDEEIKAATERLHVSQGAVDRATSALRGAIEISKTLDEDVAKSVIAISEADAAEGIATAARAEMAHADQSLTDAKGRLRDLSSGNVAQARALQRAELEKRQAEASAKRGAAITAMEAAEEVGALLQRIRLADEECAKLQIQARVAVDGRQDAQSKLKALDDEAELLRHVEILGLLRAAEAAVVAHDGVIAEGTAIRERAKALCAEADATTTSTVPTTSEIAALRQLREDRRIAEARLGGGITLVLRPRRPLSFQATRDGILELSVSSNDAPVTIAADRAIRLSIDDVADVEIAAGEASARQAAADLRDRWEREGAAVLRSHRIDTVEQLENLRAAADEAQRTADERRREAARLDAEATEREQRAGDRATLRARVLELEAEARGFDASTAAPRLAELGPDWAAALKRRTPELGRARDACSRDVESAKDIATRLETQLEGRVREALALKTVGDERRNALGGDWKELADRYRGEIVQLDRALSDCATQLAELASSDSGDEAEARASVADADNKLRLAKSTAESSQSDAQRLRDVSVGANARLEATRSRAREIDINGAWSAALLLPAPRLDLDRWRTAITEAEEVRDGVKRDLAALREQLGFLSQQRAEAIEQARKSSENAEASARAARIAAEAHQRENESLRDQITKAKLDIAALQVRVAAANLETARADAARLTLELDGLPDVGPVGESDLERMKTEVRQLQDRSRDLIKELDMARGALQHVGGAVVRERQRDLDQAIERARGKERDLEVEYEGWKLLVETLRDCETTEGAHLGRALAGPVSQRFQQLTGGRYGKLELGPHLQTTGLEVGGEIREIDALSSGTQDQLATLIRLCIAEQLGSMLLLDDQLSQSDPARVGWFNDVLRSAAQRVQVILITCRPEEILTADERPGPSETALSSAAGVVRSVNLERVIKRIPTPRRLAVPR
jgi:hypothetical protein